MKQRIPAYACELVGTAAMMAVGIGAVVFFWAQGSPGPHITNERLRLLVTGLIFASSATLVVYSPLGQLSGGHLNPAVTLGFWRLRRIGTRDALGYIIAQAIGALAGVMLVARVAGDLGRSVDLGATRPGTGVTMTAAFGYETAITFALMFLILACLNKPRLASYTGVAAGALVALLVTIEAPLTGTSLNPARSFAPALMTGRLDVIWIYLVAPPTGALLAAAAWRGRWGARQAFICAKLYHAGSSPCQFPGCPYVSMRAGDTLVRQGDHGDEAFVIESGEVEIRRGDRMLARLGPGDWFGEMSVLLDEPRSATVVATTDGRVRRLARATFDQVMADDPKHAIELMRQLAGRVREADRQLGE